MNARKYIRNALLALVVLSLLYMAARELADRHSSAVPGPAASASGNGEAKPEVIVYYFSEGKDCTTCENIEAYTKEALDTYFAPELASGRMAWRTVDVDEKRNEHYISEYQIYTKSVVLVRLDNGRQVRWKNLESVWDLVYDKKAFMDYIRTQTRSFLDAPA